ncbi:MAG TPA: PQQ-binding-like beta-propeller repeat protein [Acidimicrobiia bacterium]|nr:PQQ-binding-like beta-propeller repeat protein [Acidimicrobiia bacterium]
MAPHPRHPFIVAFVVALVLVGGSVGLYSLLASTENGETPATTLAITTTGPSTGSGGVAGTTSSTGSTSPTTSGPETSTSSADTSTSTSPTTTTEPSGPPLHRWVDTRSVGEPWGAVEGLLMFRGNPTNTWYGSGPVPETPEVKWRYPGAPMCSSSTDLGVTSTWCGNGWTGQPVIWVRDDGVTEMIFGAYDRKLHFVDTETGESTRTAFQTGDIIKGTPTIDPDGFPLVYFGSRDNKLRILALDRGDPVELWNAVANLAVEGRWNDDWDANPRIINDYMFEGSENSLFYIWKLNRSFDATGLVTVDPQLVFKMPTWNDDLMAAIGPSYPAVSVENSAVVLEGRVYFANSGGRVIGLDISDIDAGTVELVFDYWVGDDVDASIVADDEGFLYVSAEYERYLARARDLGQLIKLDPSKPDDPYVWGMKSLTDPPAKGGLWSTPALGDGVLYAVTNKGFLVVVDQETGEELFVDEVGPGSWSSPLVVDDRLLVATNPGFLRSYDIGDPTTPELIWDLKVGESALEATPAIWNGTIYVGNRDGYLYAIGE